MSLRINNSGFIIYFQISVHGCVLEAESLVSQLLCDCCGCNQSSTQVVVSRGNPGARFMLIGEAPGAREDALGEPFVGRSGKVLDQMLINVGINPSKDVFICNAVKCRPPKNRRPSKAELLSSLPWLKQQIKLVDPLVIALAGSTAVEAVLGVKEKITSLRGVWQTWEGRMVMPLFHPSYLLRNPSKVEGAPISLTRGDLLEVKNKLKEFQKAIAMPMLGCNRSWKP
ncbi:uracil-DNA glycosylase [Prochlorococcus sp. MIT 1307]|uniref:uracil-DNA glycosylase n=1 Tax=Prochlorococcus sp. MIT 1307 TaxID=3096219 RepID=UPI002A762450|nr:uracil-DNA glycosylase [Prochlorococcus sp. MIT 1307]